MAKKRQTAIGYLRVSGRSQIDGDGFSRQRQAIERYAKAHGLDIVGLHRDEGVRDRARIH